MKFNSHLLTAVLLSALLMGCPASRKNSTDPKERLKDYIDVSFNIQSVSDRSKLESFLIGETKSRLAAWSDDQFQKAFLETKRQFVKLLFREVRNLSDRDVQVVYELTYIDQNRGHNAKVTNKKMSRLVMEKNNWFIKEVTNLKELVEYQNEMALP